MRLLTHNMLQCPRTRAYPLSLTIETCDEVDVEYSETFLRRMLPRLDWNVFLAAARQLPDEELIGQLPEKAPIEVENEDGEGVLRAVHRALLQWHVVEGTLESGGGVYKVSNGVPNLVITEVRGGEEGAVAGVGGGKDADAMEEDAEGSGDGDK